ncbi:uncharacterized protein [Typha latifolia]|uniref:uncharacterized protein n=1 Tax=Typha latifolia TaxID=4733 RepID=UPI003C2C01D4
MARSRNSPPSQAAAAAAVLPVVFMDGDRSVDIGTVAVHPSLGFKKFQAGIGDLIGIAPQQISTSLVRPRKAKRNSPIDESTDFAAIARERSGDCYVVATLRRSRRERRGRSRRGRVGGGGGEPEKTSLPPAKTILRRDPKGGSLLDPAMLAGLMPEPIGVGIWDYESQMRNLQRQRERYLLSTAALAAEYYPYAASEEPYIWGSQRRAATAVSAASAVCDECELATEEGRPPAFHWCIKDAVTVGFRSPVGPIERPSKKHVEASA